MTWSVNGVSGGNASLGTVTATGLYTAPGANPGTSLTLRASAPNPAVFGEATLQWLNPEPVLTSVSPSTVNVGAIRVVLQGRGFLPSSVVFVNGSAVATTYQSPTSLGALFDVPNAGWMTVTVQNPDPGAATSQGRRLTVLEPVSLTVSPANATMRLGTTRKFSARVVNTADKRVNWSVNGIPGGDPTVGTIGPDGIYVAPWLMVAGGTVVIGAVSVADPAAASQANLTFLNPIPVLSEVGRPRLNWGSQEVRIQGTGFVPGMQLRAGSQTFETVFESPTAARATLVLSPVPGGLITLRVRNPEPGPVMSAPLVVAAAPANPLVSERAAGRFLEQASWGPDPTSLARVQEIGFEAWIDEQLTLPASSYRLSGDSSDSLVKQQSQFFANAMRNPDQLRQRVAFALGQIFVVSGVKTGEPRQMVPYQNLLLQDAFGSYARLLRDVTLSPTMGVFLDMVNNDRAEPGSGLSPNENYVREALQLFSIGTVLLDRFGQIQRDPHGLPIPTYNQALINEMARALTGWTFPGRPITQGHNREHYSGPMIPVEANHDPGSKTILGGVVLPAGNSAQADLDAVLAAIAAHPNVAPFISLRLIQHLVSSAPTPEFLGRVSQVFTDTQGDLGRVVRAILLDPEARRGDDPQAAMDPAGGHLREPILYLLSVLRCLNARILAENPIEALAADMGQKLFYPPSVFNYYSPFYRTSDGLAAPEFQLLNPATALVRVNVIQNLVCRGLDGDAHFDLGPFLALAGTPDLLVEALDRALLFGRMPASLKGDVARAIEVSPDPSERVRNAIYLIATASLYQVQH